MRYKINIFFEYKQTLFWEIEASRVVVRLQNTERQDIRISCEPESQSFVPDFTQIRVAHIAPKMKPAPTSIIRWFF